MTSGHRPAIRWGGVGLGFRPAPMTPVSPPGATAPAAWSKCGLEPVRRRHCSPAGPARPGQPVRRQGLVRRAAVPEIPGPLELPRAAQSLRSPSRGTLEHPRRSLRRELWWLGSRVYRSAREPAPATGNPAPHQRLASRGARMGRAGRSRRSRPNGARSIGARPAILGLGRAHCMGDREVGTTRVITDSSRTRNSATRGAIFSFQNPL